MTHHDLSPAMIDAVNAMGRKTVTASEINSSGASLKGLVERGLVMADREGEPPLFSLTPAGQLFLSVMRGDICLIRPESKVALIKQMVANHFEIPAIEMISERRSRRVARPRQIAMYLAKKHTTKSLPSIGRLFGNRDHTTVIHAIRTIERLRVEDEQIDDAITSVERQIAQ